MKEIYFIVFALIIGLPLYSQFDIRSESPVGSLSNGRILVTVQDDALGPYDISLSPLAGNTNEMDFVGMKVFDNLSAGRYSLIITNRYDCSYEEEIVLNGQPCSDNIITLAELNHNGDIRARIGDGNFLYELNSVSVAQFDIRIYEDQGLIQENINTGMLGADNLESGLYCIELDAKNSDCKINECVEILDCFVREFPGDIIPTLNKLLPKIKIVKIYASTKDATDDGKIEFIIENSESADNYTIRWYAESNPQVSLDIINGTLRVVPNLLPGRYCYEFTNGCGQDEENCLTIPSCESTNISIAGQTTRTCSGYSYGEIDLTVSGSEEFSYEWSDGNEQEDRINLSSGTYTVTATDKFDCSSNASFTINNNGVTVNGDVNTAACAQPRYCDGRQNAPLEPISGGFIYSPTCTVCECPDYNVICSLNNGFVTRVPGNQYGRRPTRTDDGLLICVTEFCNFRNQTGAIAQQTILDYFDGLFYDYVKVSCNGCTEAYECHAFFTCDRTYDLGIAPLNYCGGDPPGMIAPNHPTEVDLRSMLAKFIEEAKFKMEGNKMVRIKKDR